MEDRHNLSPAAFDNVARMAIDSAGQIGIGADPNSSYLLYVNGQAAFQQAIFLLGGTPSSPLKTNSGNQVISDVIDLGSPSDVGATVLGVANGGTGASSLAPNSIVVGNGSGAVSSVAAGTAGQVLMSNGSGAPPSFGPLASGVASISAGTGLSVSSSTGAVTITNTGVTSVVVGGGLSLNRTTGEVTISNSAIPAAGNGIAVAFSGADAIITNSAVPSAGSGISVFLTGSNAVITNAV